MSVLSKAKRLLGKIENGSPFPVVGKVVQSVGMLLESSGPPAAVGDLCGVEASCGRLVEAEVVGFKGRRLLLMPLQNVGGIKPNSPVHSIQDGLKFGFSLDLVGRVLDGLGRPLDGRPLPPTEYQIPFEQDAPGALSRSPIDSRFLTGVRVIDGLLSLGKGQRVGVFAGSGVGKSTLMGMIVRGSQAQVNVIGLIGERGREVGEFVRDQLGPEGMANSVVVAATSDRSPMERIKGAMLTTSIAEAFRSSGFDVCLMMDSVTRVALAQREIGLSVGEPPTSRGYTPSVFGLLPRLLERTGPGPGGHITAIYTVLVEGDDLNDPIADTVRGILDGHIVLSRKLAHKNHFPSVDVLGSVSRVMTAVASPEHQAASGRFRELLSDLEEVKELQALGAYHHGSSLSFDEALVKESAVLDFLRQHEPVRVSCEQLLCRLTEVLNKDDEI